MADSGAKNKAMGHQLATIHPYHPLLSCLSYAFLQETFQNVYVQMNYEIDEDKTWTKLSCDAKNFSENTPLFIHSYIQKAFGAIPHLYIAEPFHNNVNYSQLAMTYMVSFFLGMLVRYYPTHWITLIQGSKGDIYPKSWTRPNVKN